MHSGIEFQCEATKMISPATNANIEFNFYLADLFDFRKIKRATEHLLVSVLVIISIFGFCNPE